MKGTTMKRTLVIAALALFAMIGHAAPITVITNYFPSYVCTTSGWQTVEESGLSTNTAYVCIPLSSLPALTAAQAVATGAGSDVRMLLYAINDAAYTQYTAAPSTNRPANASISRSSSSASITNYFAGYVAVTSGWQTVSESGLSTNTAYVCIPLSSLPALTAAQAAAAGTGSDVRMLLYAVNDQAYTVYTATASTNRPANASISRSSSSASITNYATTHSLRTTWTLTTPTITPE